MSFDTLGLHSSLLAAVQRQGYADPTPIQAATIPAILSGRDVIGLAQTGTGKTAAFALPIIQRLMQGKPGGIRALIVAPTRELAEQIHDAFVELSARTGLRSATVYGGVGMVPQEKALREGVDIIVACPGRLLDHIDRGYVRLNNVQMLVLDEADRMLDMGFLPPIKRILAHLPARRQTLLFSATMPSEMKQLAASTTRDAQTIQVNPAQAAVTVTHALYPVAEGRKLALLLELLRQTQTESVLVFTRTKHRANRVAQQIENAGYSSARLHGNRSQNQRQFALDGFRDGTFQVLVATDIAARGIDVSSISHVINFDMPDTPEAYIHRIGRTGRAARTGSAFTLVTPEDSDMTRIIERMMGKPLERRSIPGFDVQGPATSGAVFARPPRPQQGQRNGQPRREASRYEQPRVAQTQRTGQQVQPRREAPVRPATRAPQPSRRRTGEAA